MTIPLFISQSGLEFKNGRDQGKLAACHDRGQSFLGYIFKAYSAPALVEYVQNMAKTNACEIVHNEPARINEIDSYGLRVKCGSTGEEVDKILNYFFTTENKVIFIGLKETQPSFYPIIENLEESVKSVKANY